MSIASIAPLPKDSLTQIDPNSKGFVFEVDLGSDPVLEQIGKDLQGTGISVPFRLVQANINFLGSNFIEGMNLSDHLEDLEAKTVDIHCYSDIEKLASDFNFHKHGFEYLQLKNENSLLGAIGQFSKAPSEKGQSELIKNVQGFLFSWGKKNGIPGVPVLWDVAYRDSASNSPFSKPFFFAHVDFPQEGFKGGSRIQRILCKLAAEDVFGSMSDEKYDNLNRHTWVNVWIALNDKPSNNTLAVMKKNSVQDLQKKLKRVSNGSGILCSVRPDPEAVWVAKENPTLQDQLLLVFDSRVALHTAAIIEGGSNAPRRSVDMRFEFCSLPQ